MKSLFLSVMTSVLLLPALFEERPLLVALPTTACSLRALVADLVVLLVEFRGVAALVLVLLLEELEARLEELEVLLEEVDADCLVWPLVP